MQEKRTDRVEVFNNIIRLILKDREKGLEKFYNEYCRIMYSVARSYCKSEDKVNSVVNSVLIRIWKKAESLNNVHNPEGFVYMMAKNCARDEVNERWNCELNENIISSENEFLEVEERDSFEYLIHTLKDDEQEIMILRFRKGYTFQDISDLQEKPLPTVTTTYYRALQKIKKVLKDKSYE